LGQDIQGLPHGWPVNGTPVHGDGAIEVDHELARSLVGDIGCTQELDLPRRADCHEGAFHHGNVVADDYQGPALREVPTALDANPEGKAQE
jgi:hypothetical protein